MDFNVTDAAVREALHDLRERVRDLEQEREQLVRLQRRSNASYADHRRELTQLLQKERAVNTAKEDALRADLDLVTAECRTLRDSIEAKRKAQQNAMALRLADERQHRDAAELEIRVGIEAAEGELRSLRDQSRRATQERDEHEAEMAAMTSLQQTLQETWQREKERYEAELSALQQWRQEHELEDERLHEALSQVRGRCNSWHYRDFYQRQSPRRRPCQQMALSKPFVPPSYCGGPRAASPVSHNINAVVSALKQSNQLRPRAYLMRRSNSEERRLREEHTRLLQPSPTHASRTLSRGRLAGAKPCALSLPPLLLCASHAGLGGSDDVARPSWSTGPGSPLGGCPGHPVGLVDCNESHPSPSERQPRARAASHARSTADNAPHSPVAAGSSSGGSSSSTQALDDAYRTALRELLEARHEYDVASIRLGAPPRYASSALEVAETERRSGRGKPGAGSKEPVDFIAQSKRLRQLISTMDAQVEQLRHIHAARTRIEENNRFRDILRDITRENSYCEAMYRDLLQLIRS